MNWTGMPPMSALRALAAFAESGRMSAAGAALNVSHAAISQHLRALEDRLGVTLLERNGKRVALTPEGVRLADAVTDGFRMMSRAVDEITGADALRPLQITTTPTFAALWLMPRLGDFRNTAPQIDVMLNPTPNIVALEPGGIDVAIRHGKGVWSNLESEVLVASPLVVVAAPELVGDRPVSSPTDLTAFPWLQEYGTNESTDWLRRHGVTKGRVAGMTQVPGNLLIEGARTGQGIVVTALEFVQEDLHSGRLRLLFTDDDGSGYHIVTRPGVLRPPARAFVRWLRRQKNGNTHSL